MYYPLVPLSPYGSFVKNLPNLREPFHNFLVANFTPAAVVFSVAAIHLTKRDITE